MPNTDFVAAANAAIERRSALFEQRAAVAADTTLSATERRSRLEALDAEMAALAKDATGHIEAAEREAELRSLNERAVKLASRKGDAGEWRNMVPTLHEWRTLISEATPAAGGYAVPENVAKVWVDKLRAKSTFLRAPGLNVIPFAEGSKFTVPQLTASTDPAVVGAGNAIPEGTLTFGGIALDPVKYAALYNATSEIVEDSSVSMEELVGQTLVRDIANVVDRDAFQGAGGTTALAGLNLAANSTITNLPAGTTVVAWDNVIDGVADIMGYGGMPTVIWASVDSWKALMKERTNVGGAGTGEYMAGDVTTDPARAALGLPLYPTANLPARTVIVCDASRVFVGVRRDIRLARSEEYKFDSDVVSWRATYRVAGISVAEATSTQVIVAAAA